MKASSYGIPTDDFLHNKMVQSASEINSGMITIPINLENFKEFSRLLCENRFAGTPREEFNGLIPTRELYPNQCCIFEAEQTKSMLAIYKDDGEQPPRFVHVQKPQPGPGVQPRNIGQAFELALLPIPLSGSVRYRGLPAAAKRCCHSSRDLKR